ncbi:glycoside hydrolase family 47 protein [Collybia nuda]|uniref:alpha-1,2-Mannosidase n=1 Tax=Collybia nuda TaxID=64659 RepID=A0A9P5YHS3_9AGAR|nr:glycoside hydrolase family 47 protein [Collybia nuda]
MAEPQIRKQKRGKAQPTKSEAGPQKEQTVIQGKEQDGDWQKHTTLLSFILLAGGIAFAYLVPITQLYADIPKRDAVVSAFKHAWLAYERDAMGDDEYHPIAKKGSNLSHAGGIGYTVVDSIDTMLVMGLQEEYSRARDWVANKMSVDRDDKFSTFETTIRVIGGLLSAYHLSSEDPIYLEKAVDLADRILPAFDTPSGLPQTMVNLATGEGIANTEFPGLVTTAEVATLQLEFRYLSHLTGKEIYWQKVENVMRVIKAARLPHGLASIFMNVESGQYETSAIRLGARGDSFYEYLLKQYIQTNDSEFVYREMYDNAMDAIHKHIIQISGHSKMTYTAELIPERDPNGEVSWRLVPKQDHLACFFGGSLMLGATKAGATVKRVSVPPRADELSEFGKRDWQTGVDLVKTCLDTHDTTTGLSPEVVHFRIPSDGMEGNPMAPTDWYIKGAQAGAFPPYDARYMLRPETVESLFIAYRLTGDPRYREYGWKIFQSIEKHCRVETGGYATVVNVDEVPARLEDKMETFLMSETLKYLYLLFDDSSVLPLDKYVFNTEAHPLPIFKPMIATGFT